MERRVPARSCRTGSRPTSPTSATAASTSSWTSTRTRAWSTARATTVVRSSRPFNRTGTSRTRTNDNKSQYNALQMKIDRRFQQRVPGHQLLHAEQVDGLRERERRHQHADRLQLQLGALELRPARTTTCCTVIYELPWGPNKKWLNEGLLGKIIGGWQLSSIFVAQSGMPLSITASGTLLNTPGNTAYAEPGRRRRTILGGLGPGPALLRSDGLRAAGERNAGQHEAQQRSGGSGLLGARFVAVQAVRGRRRSATPRSASTRTT